jgi:hypothetical protein
LVTPCERMHWAYFSACWVELFDAPDELEPPDDPAAVVVVDAEFDDPPPHAASVTARPIKSAPNGTLLRISDRRARMGSGLPGESDIPEAPFGLGAVWVCPSVLRPFAVSLRLHRHG